MLTLLALLLTAVVASMLARNGAALVTSAVLLANWGVNSAFAAMCTDPAPWMFYIVADYLSGISLLLVRSSRWQTIVILIYAAQILAHAAYGLSGKSAWAQYTYWWLLYETAIAQIAVVGGWLAHQRYRDWSGAGSRVSINQSRVKECQSDASE